ncbi:MAG: LysR family transcriptional regulator [Candidatus Lokiarchaeia archaeon]|nr:LysR family transcriptional regulator [Candidatus Lokiarchaeia archaeon]
MESQSNIEDLKSKVGFGIKFWLEFDNKSILGSGWAELLDKIKNNEEGSLTLAAKECGYSYKYAWNILKRIERRTGMSVVRTGKGGRGGGGWVKLNEWGEYLLKIYIEYSKEIKKIENRLQESITNSE